MLRSEKRKKFMLNYHIKTLCLAICFSLVAGCIESNEPDTPTQRTATEHMDNVHQIAAIVENYKAVTGNYPYRENWGDVESTYVAVSISTKLTTEELPEEFRYPPPGVSGAVISSNEFEDYLSAGLNKKVVLPKDNRRIKRDGRNWPFFYQFLYDGEHYYVSCFLQEDHPKARQIGRNWFKYEVGSIEIPNRKIHKFVSKS